MSAAPVESLSPERVQEVQKDMADALREQGEDAASSTTATPPGEAAEPASKKTEDVTAKDDKASAVKEEKKQEEKEKEKGGEEEDEKEEEEADPKKVELVRQGYQDILGSGAIWKKILRQGDSDERAQQGDVVTIRTELRVDGSVLFQDKEFVFRAGEGDVCQAWDLIVKLMKIGEVAHVIGSSRFDSRKECKQGKIEYTIALLECKPADEIDSMSLQDRLQEGLNKRARAKEWVALEEHDSAARSLKRGLEFLKIEGVDESKLGENADVFKKIKIERAALSCNLALVYQKFSKFREMVELCDQALECDPMNIKGYYIKGKALLALNEPEDAAKCLTLGIKLQPTNTDLRKLLSECDDKRKSILAKEREQFKRMISALGSSPDVLAQEKERLEREKQEREAKEKKEKEDREERKKRQLWISVGVLVFAIVAFFAAQYFGTPATSALAPGVASA